MGRQRLELVFESTGLWEWNFGRGKCSYSPGFSRLLNYDSNELPVEEAHFFELIHPEDRDLLRKAVQDETTDERLLNFTARFRVKSGCYRWFLVNGKAHPTERSFVGTIADIHEIVAEREKLEEKATVLEDFSRNVAHDLKEPIRGISNYTTILLETDELKLPEEAHGSLEKIRMLTLRTIDMIDGLLKYAMHYSDRSFSKLIDPSSFVVQLREELNVSQRGADLEIIETLPVVRANPDVLKEIFRNLISNAVKHNAKTSKRVELGGREVPDGYLFYVRDNGPGIPAEERDRVFDLFFRGRHTNRKLSTGIGLGIVKKCVEMEGGRIWLESVEGQGSTFYFTVPKTRSAENESLGQTKRKDRTPTPC